eukprot:CAMPEP_0205919816 /NCGR_PEP_ID=MMETSP1325-20131115/10681_1 /ASSEMBLY_ACC=CAM_ASM_000708 /TAXON_ID=236786 /ORGANISM="Florenciella sp., Strain RCC1007" /LENGTH=122 /DNA_ID=CAMNT_0053287455 /DNA_START=266 /DNA_END=634 /DNA_ORIENTATION=-
MIEEATQGVVAEGEVVLQDLQECGLHMSEGPSETIDRDHDREHRRGHRIEVYRYGLVDTVTLACPVVPRVLYAAASRRTVVEIHEVVVDKVASVETRADVHIMVLLVALDGIPPQSEHHLSR